MKKKTVRKKQEGRSLERMVRAIRRWAHRCEWEGSRYNGYGIPVEEFCRGCGKYRHHMLADVRGEEIAWRDGKHPNRDNWRADCHNARMSEGEGGACHAS